LGAFTLNQFTHDTYYSIDEYKTEGYALSILVFVDTLNDLKHILEKLYGLLENIREMDNVGSENIYRKIGCERRGFR
jgi:hypothetical protein